MTKDNGAMGGRICVLGSVLALMASCTTPNPVSCADGFCSDQSLPFCDVDGSLAGSPNACIAVSCTPTEFEACRGDEALICNGTGDDFDVTLCEGGCDATIGGCKPTHLIPKYLPDVCDQPAIVPDLTIMDSRTFDTDVDSECNGGVVAQTNGPDLCVLRYGVITLDRNATLAVIGSRAIAFVADQALTIDGTLDISANGTERGPAGGFIVSGTAGTFPIGSGGAGFKTAGGAGGTTTTDGGAANGGAESVDPALLVELVGGTRNDAVFCGGGGGAATLISCRNGVSVPGIIDAGGGGGSGGQNLGFPFGAGGGGAGGNVVLQGMTVTVTGEMFANGGGGGAGAGSGLQGAAGADGARSIAAAQGGVGVNGGGSGGAGGAAESPLGGIKRLGSDTSNSSAGGGGGSAGFLQVYTPMGVLPVLTPAVVSPEFQPNDTIPVR